MKQSKMNEALYTDRDYIKRCSFCSLFSSLFLILVFVNEYGIETVKKSLILAVLICVLNIAVLFSSLVKKLEIHHIAIVVLLIFGLLSLFIQPILNIPDEEAHFARAELTSRLHLFIPPQATEHTTIQATADLVENQKLNYLRSTIQGVKINQTPVSCYHVAGSNLFFLYIPQAIGILLAKLLGLDVIWMLWLGRLCNLLLYTTLTGLAIKMIPQWKLPLFFVACLPMSVQQAASFNPDATINALAFLLIAYYVRLLCAPEASIRGKHLSIFAVLAALLTLSKVTNVLFVALILTIPNNRFRNRRNIWLAKGGILFLVLLVGIVYYGYTSTFAVNPIHQKYYEDMGISPAEQTQYILSSPLVWLNDFIKMCMEQLSTHIDTISSFGWMEYQYSFLNLIAIFMFGKLCLTHVKTALSGWSKFFVFGIAVGVYFATCLAMYLTWSPVEADHISGVQGRYLIPAFALLPLLFSSASEEPLSENPKAQWMERTTLLTVSTSMIGAMLMLTVAIFYR